VEPEIAGGVGDRQIAIAKDDRRDHRLVLGREPRE
jgi:hypothetical protein